MSTELPATMRAAKLGLAADIEDEANLARSIDRFRTEGILLPTFAELANPSTIPAAVAARLGGVDPGARNPANLFRVHWYNRLGAAGFGDQVDHVVLDRSFTGIDAPIIVVFGDRFPMIDAHKVLAAYACLVARLVTGQFDPTRHRAIWPSTGNYARGGVAISRIMASRGVAVLPENMSQERFDWIYDACAELEADPTNFVLNQFCEFANYLVHRTVTGAALADTFERVAAAAKGADGRDLRLAAWVSATGAAGTIAAGDHLKRRYGTRIAAVEALECPTMLYNGFGEHNIQGIGDKHIPLIHNITTTDVVAAISEGRARLAARGVSDEVLSGLDHMGLSSICNIVAAIKTAKRLDLGPDDAVITVATDGAALYGSERASLLEGRYGNTFGDSEAAAAIGEHLDGVDVAHTEELGTVGRNRIFNLGYFTWVEQQGVDLETFEARRSQSFWDGLEPFVARWDELIGEFNARTGVSFG